MLINSFAKINLSLEIEGQLDSGFHAVSTFLAKIPLVDQLEFEATDSSEFELIGEVDQTDQLADNLIYRAGQLLRDRYQVEAGFRCQVNKNIPVRAGLGGGSSNAASTLLALNQLWRLNLTTTQLLPLARELGSDVPFFLNDAQVVWEPNHGAASDRLQQIAQPELPAGWLLIIKPTLEISTQQAFADFDQAPLFNDRPAAHLNHPVALNSALMSQNLELLAAACQNDFQPIIWSQSPFYAAAEELLISTALNVTLSGSGSTIYAFFPEHQPPSALLLDQLTTLPDYQAHWLLPTTLD